MPLGLVWHAAHENARIRALGKIAARLAELTGTLFRAQRAPGSDAFWS